MESLCPQAIAGMPKFFSFRACLDVVDLFIMHAVMNGSVSCAWVYMGASGFIEHLIGLLPRTIIFNTVTLQNIYCHCGHNDKET